MPGFAGATQGSTNDRGYGWHAHMKPRQKAFAALPEWSYCARCGLTGRRHLINKHEKDRLGRSALHYDHTDARDGYLGFSHRACNVRAGAAKGGRVAGARRAARRHPRPWRSRNW